MNRQEFLDKFHSQSHIKPEHTPLAFVDALFGWYEAIDWASFASGNAKPHVRCVSTKRGSGATEVLYAFLRWAEKPGLLACGNHCPDREGVSTIDIKKVSWCGEAFLIMDNPFGTQPTNRVFGPTSQVEGYIVQLRNAFPIFAVQGYGNSDMVWTPIREPNLTIGMDVQKERCSFSIHEKA